MRRWTWIVNVAARVTLGLVLASGQGLEAQQGSGIGEVTLFGEEALTVQASTKTEVPLSEAPGSVTVITAKQIRESAARTVPDLLRMVAGVNVRWNPMGQTVDVRGFGENPFSNRMLFLIDGVPYNSGDTGGFPLSPALDFLPIENIKRIEVVRGAGSSLYGENAFWGVVNIVTFSGEDILGGNIEVFGGDRGTGKVAAQYGVKSGDASLFASARYLRTAYPMRFWEESDSEYGGSDIFLKGRYKGFQLSYYRHDESLDGFEEPFPIESGLPPGSVFRSAPELEQTTDILALNYASRKDKPVTYEADVSYSKRDGMHCAACHAAMQEEDFSHAEDHGYQLIGDLRVGIRAFPGHDILVGIEGRRLDRGDHVKELSPDAEVVKGYNKLAAYIQDQFSVFQDKVRIVLGLRHDGSTDLFDSDTTPRISIVATPNHKSVIRAGYSTAFRYPTFSELYQDTWFIGLENDLGLFPPFPLAAFAPNPDLEPEKIRTYELGGEYQISSSLAAKVDLFRSEIEDFMVTVVNAPPPPGLPTLRIENHPGEATVSGFTAELKANLPNSITGFVNWTHQSEDRSDQAVDSSGLPIEFVYSPDDKINLGVYGGPWAGVHAAAELMWRDDYLAPFFWYAILGTPQTPLDGYTLLNARLGYDIPFDFGPGRNLRVSLYMDNLLDETPRETLIGVDTSLPGREFFGEVAFRF